MFLKYFIFIKVKYKNLGNINDIKNRFCSIRHFAFIYQLIKLIITAKLIIISGFFFKKKGGK